MPTSLARLIAVAAALTVSAAAAQEYPAREIRSICNFAAGSGSDILVRFYSDRLSKLAGKPVIAENKVGARGAIATEALAKSRPDGLTLMITPASSTIAAAPHLFKQLPFGTTKDFAAVTTIASLSFVIAVDAARPIQSIPETVNSGPLGLARFSTLRAWLSQWSIDDTNAHGERCAASVTVPLLAIENTADDAVPQPHTGRIYRAAKSADKTFEAIKGATHYYVGQPELLQQVVDLCVDWMSARKLVD